MRIRLLAIAATGLALGTTGTHSAAAAQQSEAGPARTELRASLHFDDEGNHYRKAARGTRAGMSRAARSAGMFAVTDRFAWYVGTIDTSVGYVCGERDGNVGGTQVIKRKGRWSAPKNPSSGAIQTADYNCGAYDD